MTNIRPSTRARATRTFGSLMTEIPMTRDIPASHALATPTSGGTTAIELPARSTAVHLLHEDLARAQIRERLKVTDRERQAAQLVRARRLSRRGQGTPLRARISRARFN